MALAHQHYGDVPIYTLAQLRVAETQDVIAARIKAAISLQYTSRSLPDPTPSWTPAEQGGPEMTVVNMVAGTLAALVSAQLAQAVGGRFLDLAKGDDLTQLALLFFQLGRAKATKTIESVELFAVLEAGEHTFEPGDVWVASKATQNRYVNLDRIVVPAGNNAPPARFEAENAGSSYSDAQGTIDTMVVAPAGVGCTNIPASDYLPAQQNGSSTGTMDAFGADPDNVDSPTIQVIRVRIDTSGDIGTATFAYSTDGGSSWNTGNVVPSGTFRVVDPNNPGTGDAKLLFKNGTTPSFVAGSIFTFYLGNAILSQGRDEETDEALRVRCRSRWPGLSLVPTDGLVRLWALEASDEVHKVIADADPNTPGGMIVTLASAAGPASAAAQTAVDDYITARLRGFKGVPAPGTGIGGSPEETVLVRSAKALQITPAGTVDVPRDKVTQVQQLAEQLWDAYLRNLPIGGVVVLAELEQAIMDAGAITFSGILLNGLNRNVQLAGNEVAVPADGTSLTLNLVWRPGSGTGAPVKTMSTDTGSTALTFATRNEIEATLLAFLQDPDFPVTDWNSGGVVRTILEIQTDVLDDLIGTASGAIPAMLVQGQAQTSDGDWLTAVAHGLFAIEKRLGTVSIQTVILAATATAGTNVFTAGTRVFLATDGRRYVTATGGTLSPSGTLALDVTSESPGAAHGLVNRLESPLAGVSVVSAAIKVVSTVPQFGSDDETDTALIGRCLARWPSLTDIDTNDRVDIWARAASTEVTRTRMDADTINPGGVILTVAGTSGAVSGGAVTTAQGYIDARAPITDFITAQNASNLTITASAEATVPAARLAEIQAAADASWNAYLAQAQIGGIVYRARLLQAIMDAGAIDVVSVRLNGFGVDVALSSTQVPVPDGAGLATLITWDPI